MSRPGPPVQVSAFLGGIPARYNLPISGVPSVSGDVLDEAGNPVEDEAGNPILDE